MRIPITMCHGIRREGDYPLSPEYLAKLMEMVVELGFESINYDQLDLWRRGEGKLPPRPFMFDVDHPERSVFDEVQQVLDRYGLKGNLFINTGPMDELHAGPMPAAAERTTMTWDEVRELMANGWHIGAHTVSHANLSDLHVEDPTGATIAAELDQCNETLRRELATPMRDFAFTGTSCSSSAEREVAKRYRFGRLWIRRLDTAARQSSTDYEVDGRTVRYAEHVGSDEPNDPDGGPPVSVRYITESCPPYRLPAMELQSSLMHSPDAFRRYLEGALS
jgi:peptidoglycan/xylan/chitin deacetylase (PgdA/CDA1 family)